MQVTPAPFRTMDPDPTRTYPVRAPQTRHSSHQGNLQTHFSFLVHDHSFIHSHAHIHTFGHTFIRTFIPYIQALHMQIVASQRFVSCHKAIVVSFDMSGDRPRFEGWPAVGGKTCRCAWHTASQKDQLDGARLEIRLASTQDQSTL